ncbi:MAG: tripartite tricarboxylate transporter substrate binding protein [Betaproteobacteria bacterium]|nr:tripartite tricarboxylate transporter substrate binding protein [Betaproteobacteria bacterium]
MDRKKDGRSHVARWLFLPLAVFAWSGPAPAAEYPSRPLRLVVSFPPGGSADFQARIIGPKLTEQLQQQIVVDNRSGGGGVIALELVARSTADGYTLLLGPSSALAVNPNVFAKLPYDPVKDFAPISMTSRVTLAVVAAPSLPVSSMKGLIALAKASPGKITYGSTGIGGVAHLAGEMLKSMAGVDLIHVPYKGAGPQLVDIMSDNVAVGFASLTSAIPHMRAGRLKVLVVTSSKRSSAAPDVPTVSEAGLPGLEIATGWFGILAPAHTPKAVISRLNSDVVRAIQSPDLQKRFLAQGLDPATSTAEEFAALIRTERAKWAEVVKQTGIRLN